MTNLPKPFPFWFPYLVITGFLMQLSLAVGIGYGIHFHGKTVVDNTVWTVNLVYEKVSELF
jgi:hypothetical protein